MLYRPINFQVQPSLVESRDGARLPSLRLNNVDEEDTRVTDPQSDAFLSVNFFNSTYIIILSKNLQNVLLLYILKQWRESEGKFKTPI